MSVHPEHLTYILNYKWIVIKLSVQTVLRTILKHYS